MSRAFRAGVMAALAASGVARAEGRGPTQVPAPATIEVADEDGAVPLERARASITRTAPIVDQLGAVEGDLTFVASGGAPPTGLEVASLDEHGVLLEVMPLVFAAAECPRGRSAPCLASPPLRLASAPFDRALADGARPTLHAALGGVLEVRGGGRVHGRVPVLAPDGIAPGFERARLRLRVRLVRLSPGGTVPIGEDDAHARELARETVEQVGALWASCGFGVGPPRELDVAVVDPPPPHLVAVGCSHGLPASGGELALSVAGRAVRVAIPRGSSPAAAARRLASAIEAMGFSARVSDNARGGAAALPTSDVLVASRSGAPVGVSALPGSVRGKDLPVSTDATLRACIGSVELGDGLEHFGDVDAAVGTLEERTLIKALDDHDPSTIDVLVVPGFARGGRIGESFIASDRGSIAATVLLDRAGMRPGRAVTTLAHELGHVLLDDPGHSDDFGTDTPTALMDADASDPSPFGPRRLSLEECRRAFRQSGPGAAVRMLRPWPPFGGTK